MLYKILFFFIINIFTFIKSFSQENKLLFSKDISDAGLFDKKYEDKSYYKKDIFIERGLTGREIYSIPSLTTEINENIKLYYDVNIDKYGKVLSLKVQQFDWYGKIDHEIVNQVEDFIKNIAFTESNSGDSGAISIQIQKVDSIQEIPIDVISALDKGEFKKLYILRFRDTIGFNLIKYEKNSQKLLGFAVRNKENNYRYFKNVAYMESLNDSIHLFKIENSKDDKIGNIYIENNDILFDLTAPERVPKTENSFFSKMNSLFIRGYIFNDTILSLVREEPPNFEYIKVLPTSEDLKKRLGTIISIRRNGFMGIEDIYGKKIISCKYNSIEPFFNLSNKQNPIVYKTSHNQLFGLLNSDLNVLYNTVFSQLDINYAVLRSYNCGVVEYKGFYGLIDINYQVFLDPVYESIKLLDKRYALIKDASTRVYRLYNTVTRSFLGVMYSKFDYDVLYSYVEYYRTNYVGLLDSNLETIIGPEEKYTFISKVGQGKLVAAKGFVFSNNNKIDVYILTLSNKSKVLIPASVSNSCSSFGQYSEGFIPYKDRSSGKYGYLNVKGEIAIKPQFDQAESFYEGTARVIKFETSYRINTKGEILFGKR